MNDINRRYEEVLQTYDEDGNVINTYTYGVDRINSTGQNNETYLYDGRGSVAGSVSDDVMTSYAYTAYGELMPESAVPNVYGYNGEQTDFITGQQYLRTRYYDTTVQRFVNEDAWRGKYTYPKSMNKYGYTYNNPVMYADDGGNRPVELTEVNTHTMQQVSQTTQADLYEEYQRKKQEAIARSQEEELRRMREMKDNDIRDSVNVPTDWH